jgi:hypothetical protein
VKERRVWLPATAVLVTAYCFTLAPSVTLWDAGEFIAAAHSLGIPHPPGTPLFILLLHVWGLPWPDASYAFGLNLASAVATASAAALSATLVFRWLRGPWGDRSAFAGATAAALCAGAMYTAWSNATETEVYAASLALSVVTLFAAERRRELLVAYCFGLAAALHVSALVASPAAILLAATREDTTLDTSSILRLGGAALASMAIGTWNPWIGGAAVVVVVLALCHPERSEGSAPRTYGSLASLGMTILGASPLLFMFVRAHFDPAINQGNPATLQALADVIARRQYELAPLWPRRAPVWLQLSNWFEYADWQTALSLGPGVIPTVQRTFVSLVFAMFAVVGAAEHRRMDRRSWRALLALFVAGTVGVTLYLNLRASPSFGWGVLPDGAVREARERDYFFVLGFWACGLWAGLGAVTIVRRRGLPIAGGVLVAGLPIALNWSAVNRRSEPDAHFAMKLAAGLVSGLPERTVLFVAGDNDTYPVWFSREVLGERRDVTVVTVPLIGAPWYTAELIRRNRDLEGSRTSEGVDLRSIASAARDAGRPVAASITLNRSDRVRLNGCWRVIGAALLDYNDGDNCLSENSSSGGQEFPLDSALVAEWVRRNSPEPVGWVKPSIDPAPEYFARALDCPRRMLAIASKKRGGVSLDSTCKL